MILLSGMSSYQNITNISLDIKSKDEGQGEMCS
jgi:hypothetical protein